MKNKILGYFLTFAAIPLFCGLGYILYSFLLSPEELNDERIKAGFMLFVFVPLPYILFSLLCSLLFDQILIIMISALGISLLLLSQLYRIMHWPHQKWILMAGTILTLAAMAYFVYSLIIPDEEKPHVDQ